MNRIRLAMSSTYWWCAASKKMRVPKKWFAINYLDYVASIASIALFKLSANQALIINY